MNLPEEYSIREATLNDSGFLAEAIMQAEKSSSSRLSFATLFDLSEDVVKTTIQSMLAEEIDGCEFSVSSFLLVEHGSTPVAAVAGWIEEFEEEAPSKLLKSNLMFYTFPKDKLIAAKERNEVIKSIQIDREGRALQIEYVYVHEAHRNKRLAYFLIDRHISRAKERFAGLQKVQVQVFGNNPKAIRLYASAGFAIASTFRGSEKALDYLPHNEKLLMEKQI